MSQAPIPRPAQRTQSTERTHALDSDHASRSEGQSESGRQERLESLPGPNPLSADYTLKVIAVDPGETTGYAHGFINEGCMIVATGQQKWDSSGLWDHLAWYQPAIIVYETFDFRRSNKYQRDRVNLFARELIGVLNLYEQKMERGLVELHPQRPTIMSESNYFNTNRLKKEGVYKPGKKHANEAVRHLLYWFTFGKGYKYNKKGFKVAT